MVKIMVGKKPIDKSSNTNLMGCWVEESILSSKTFKIDCLRFDGINFKGWYLKLE